ncbi:MAG: hypothetical protein AAF670_12450 [Planctomycetota bacterium]
MSFEVVAFRVFGTICRGHSTGMLYLSSCMVLALFMGCRQETVEIQRGHLVDVQGNEHMQLELVADGPRQQLIVNVLESGTTTPYSVASKKLDVIFSGVGPEIPVRLAPDPRPSDPLGSTSRFAIDFETIPKPLHEAGDYTARFLMEVQGSAVTGQLQHRDDHTHAHPHD